MKRINFTVYFLVKRAVILVIGAVIAAIGLNAFLIPNHLTDGGIVGVSIISSSLSGLPLGVFLFAFNLPFIYLGYKKLGAFFAYSSLFGIIVLSVVSALTHGLFTATTEPILAAVFGGAIVGVGVGLVIRYGGTMDGTEVIAVLVDKRSPFSVGQIIMFLNIFILSSAGFVFGWNEAMYSMIAYFVAYKTIDVTVEGLDESKSVWIVSKEHELIGRAIRAELGRKVTYVDGRSDRGGTAHGILFSVITRIEEQRLKKIVDMCDPDAFVAIGAVHEVIGKNFKRRAV